MARIRTVKPDFWSHPVLGRASEVTKLLALALINLADDEGYFAADPVLVRNFARPFDDDSRNVTGSLQDLSRMGWIQVRNHPEQGAIGWVVNFAKHQVISHPKPSKIKQYYDSSIVPVIVQDASIPEWNREQGIGKGNTPLPPKGARRMKKAEKLEAFQPDTVAMVRRLVAKWPRKRVDDSKVANDDVAACEAVEARLAEFPDHLTLELLESAANAWLDSMPDFPNAIQFFFGPGKDKVPGPWKREVKAILTIRRGGAGHPQSAGGTPPPATTPAAKTKTENKAVSGQFCEATQ